MTEWVIDRNLIRRKEFDRYKENLEDSFILTDTFLVEAIKNHDSWKETLCQDLKALMTVRARTRMARSVSKVLRIEMEQRRAVTRDEWFSPELQTLLDRLFCAVSRGGDDYNRMIQQIQDILPDVRSEQSTADRSKERYTSIVDELRRNLDNHDLSALRGGLIPKDAELGLVVLITQSAYDAVNAANGKLPPIQTKSATARFMLLTVLRGVSWVKKGGLDGAKGSSLHNDDYDNEYIVVGSYFNGTLTNDTRAKEAEENLMRIISSASETDLVTAFQDYKRKNLKL